MATPTASTSSVLLLVLVALAGLAAAARPVDMATHTSTSGAADVEEVDAGIMECMLGCFTKTFACTGGCMEKGPDLPLCIVQCNENCVVCAVRCGLTPPPPGPKPPAPKPPMPPPLSAYDTKTLA